MNSTRAATHAHVASVVNRETGCLSLSAAGTLKGDVRVSGHPKVQATFARVMGYVEQFDIHSPNVGLLACIRCQRYSAAHGAGSASTWQGRLSACTRTSQCCG